MNPSNKTYREGEPCEHPGCLRHVTHPCEGCGRIMGKALGAHAFSYVGLTLETAYELQRKDLVPVTSETMTELLKALGEANATERRLRKLLFEIENLAEYPESPWEDKIYNLCLQERYAHEGKSLLLESAKP